MTELDGWHTAMQHFKRAYKDESVVSNIATANFDEELDETKKTDLVNIDENMSYRSCIPMDSDKYAIGNIQNDFQFDTTMPGIIDVSSIHEDESEFNKLTGSHQDVFKLDLSLLEEKPTHDIHVDLETEMIHDTEDLSDDGGSGSESDKSSLILNVWNEDYDGNPDPEVLHKLIHAKRLPRNIDPYVLGKIKRAKIIHQIRTLEDDESSQGSCGIMFDRMCMPKFCANDELTDEGSYGSLGTGTCSLVESVKETSVAGTIDSEIFQFKRPKRSQYALIPDKQFIPGASTDQLVMMLPKNKSDLLEQNLPIQQANYEADDDSSSEGRRTCVEKGMEFTLQKYDQTPHRIAELVLTGKQSVVPFDSNSTAGSSIGESFVIPVEKVVDLDGCILRGRRIVGDEDSVEESRSVVSETDTETSVKEPNSSLTEFVKIFTDPNFRLQHIPPINDIKPDLKEAIEVEESAMEQLEHATSQDTEDSNDLSLDCCVSENDSSPDLNISNELLSESCLSQQESSEEISSVSHTMSGLTFAGQESSEEANTTGALASPLADKFRCIYKATQVGSAESGAENCASSSTDVLNSPLADNFRCITKATQVGSVESGAENCASSSTDVLNSPLADNFRCITKATRVGSVESGAENCASSMTGALNSPLADNFRCISKATRVGSVVSRADNCASSTTGILNSPLADNFRCISKATRVGWVEIEADECASNGDISVESSRTDESRPDVAPTVSSSLTDGDGLSLNPVGSSYSFLNQENCVSGTSAQSGLKKGKGFDESTDEFDQDEQSKQLYVERQSLGPLSPKRQNYSNGDSSSSPKSNGLSDCCDSVVHQRGAEDDLSHQSSTDDGVVDLIEALDMTLQLQFTNTASYTTDDGEEIVIAVPVEGILVEQPKSKYGRIIAPEEFERLQQSLCDSTLEEVPEDDAEDVSSLNGQVGGENIDMADIQEQQNSFASGVDLAQFITGESIETYCDLVEIENDKYLIQAVVQTPIEVATPEFSSKCEAEIIERTVAMKKDEDVGIQVIDKHQSLIDNPAEESIQDHDEEVVEEEDEDVIANVNSKANYSAGPQDLSVDVSSGKAIESLHAHLSYTREEFSPNASKTPANADSDSDPFFDTMETPSPNTEKKEAYELKVELNEDIMELDSMIAQLCHESFMAEEMSPDQKKQKEPMNIMELDSMISQLNDESFVTAADVDDSTMPNEERIIPKANEISIETAEVNSFPSPTVSPTVPKKSTSAGVPIVNVVSDPTKKTRTRRRKRKTSQIPKKNTESSIVDDLKALRKAMAKKKSDRPTSRISSTSLLDVVVQTEKHSAVRKLSNIAKAKKHRKCVRAVT